ncbi:MAG: AMP-binding protein [Candidatus Micrarchaeia archaeon]
MLDYLSLASHFFDLRKEQRLDPESLLALQERRLRDLIDWSRRSTHYASAFGSISSEEAASDPRILPFTLKSQLQSTPKSFLCAGGGSTLKTSGTSGKPLSISIGRADMARRVALRHFIEAESGLSPRDLYLEISFRPMLMSHLLCRLGVFRRRVVPMLDDPEKILSALRSSRPDAIGLYPSMLSILAKTNDRLGRPLSLKMAFSTAETLSPDCRELLGSSFSCPVFNQYGSTELGYVAWECPEEHRMHVSSSHLVEIVDKSGRPRRSGRGELVVTPLLSRAMPLIRYRIGDMARWGRECPCGRGLRVLEGIDGRKEDMITLPSGRQVPPHSLVRMHRLDSILSYQIIQEEPGLFVFRHIPAVRGHLSERSKREIRSIIEEGCLGEAVKVEFVEADSMEKSRSGKCSVVISKVGK